MEKKKGSFTLPGEAGYEELTLKLAERWGADVIRDSDGTELSEEITSAGYGIYSTICLIRDHNDWARAHRDQLQQTFLMTEPRTALGDELKIHLMEDFCAFHDYTVSFLAYRIWEEISMYNHVTNNWEKEHLMPVDPIHEETREYLYGWLKEWCDTHPVTTVVRFTSLFYNFVWMWGSDEKKRNLFTDWGSYDFTVSPAMLAAFEAEYGYSLSAEDFINQGKFHVTHMPPSGRQLDYMAFVNRFVVDFGKRLVELVHSYGKKAYVFYDDSWVGLEPYHDHFKEFGFDGLIKCVFSGYEARLCAGVEVETHELRLHPYLFPVGLGGAPTFCEGGDPVRDAKEYWIRVRRALLREKIDRIGLGGYLHLVEEFPDFCSYMETVADDFRLIKSFHEEGGVYTLPIRAAVLHSWGKLRSWTLSGHFHETYMHDLIHINEALSGLPVSVEFINFEDVKAGCLEGVDVLINAGAAGSAWSGGMAWADSKVTGEISRWVYEGGVFLGVGEPSAAPGAAAYFRMAAVLGVDEDTGARVCHGRRTYELTESCGLIPAGASVRGRKGIFLTSADTEVLREEDGLPVITSHRFGSGTAFYLSSFQVTPENTRMLLNLMISGMGLELNQNYLTDSSDTECAWYPASGKLVVINNSGKEPSGRRTVQTEPFGLTVLE